MSVWALCCQGLSQSLWTRQICTYSSLLDILSAGHQRDGLWQLHVEPAPGPHKHSCSSCSCHCQTGPTNKETTQAFGKLGLNVKNLFVKNLCVYIGIWGWWVDLRCSWALGAVIFGDFGSEGQYLGQTAAAGWHLAVRAISAALEWVGLWRASLILPISLWAPTLLSVCKIEKILLVETTAFPLFLPRYGKIFYCQSHLQGEWIKIFCQGAKESTQSCRGFMEFFTQHQTICLLLNLSSSLCVGRGLGKYKAAKKNELLRKNETLDPAGELFQGSWCWKSCILCPFPPLLPSKDSETFFSLLFFNGRQMSKNMCSGVTWLKLIWRSFHWTFKHFWCPPAAKEGSSGRWKVTWPILDALGLRAHPALMMLFPDHQGHAGLDVELFIDSHQQRTERVFMCFFPLVLLSHLSQTNSCVIQPPFLLL